MFCFICYAITLEKKQALAKLIESPRLSLILAIIRLQKGLSHANIHSKATVNKKMSLGLYPIRTCPVSINLCPLKAQIPVSWQPGAKPDVVFFCLS